MWLERLYDDFTTPTRGRPDPRIFLGIAFIMLGVLLLVLAGVFAAITGAASPFVFAVGFLFFVLAALAFFGLRSPQEGRGGTSANRACPKCGAPPGAALSAHGLTKCSDCGETYFAS